MDIPQIFGTSEIKRLNRAEYYRLRSRSNTLLVCRLPRDQIVAQAEDLRKHGTILLTQEDLEAALQSASFPGDPDVMLDKAIAALSGPSST